jgi:hypothetical protein
MRRRRPSRSFTEYLTRHRGSDFSLLANVAEEGHVQETDSLPARRRPQGADHSQDRPALSRHPLAAAISLGYEKRKRKNEKVLLSALTNPAHFEPWLQAWRTAEVPLAGIYTVAQLGGQLLRKIGQNAGRCPAADAAGSVDPRKLPGRWVTPMFSRMAPLTDSSIGGIASQLRRRGEQAAPVPDRPAPDRPRRCPAGLHSSLIR